MKKTLLMAILLVLLIAVLPASLVSAAPPAQDGGQDYTVQADDWLSKLADKFYGDVNAYWAIMSATNKANAEDPSYAKITNPDTVEVGSKLRIPAQADAEAFMKTFDPNKSNIGQLFGAGAKGQLVVASWWTAGGEAEGLNKIYALYNQKFPDVEVINAAVAGGAGTNFKAGLATRLAAGAPPDAFQLHAGLEVESYSPDQYLDPVDDVYASEGLEAVFPADLIALLKYKDHYWGVPVNIHRSNVLWYNKDIFAANGLTPPATWEEFKTVADKLQAAGVQPFGFGTKEGWEAAHQFEDVLASTLGAEGYKGLWTGATPWTDPKVTQALENFKLMLSYANADHPARRWQEACDLVLEGKAGMCLMGDWADGYYRSKGYSNYGWAPPPGGKGIFVFLSDTFALPKAAPNKENAREYLKICGSRAAQEAFNREKGSICARTDCDPAVFAPYLQSAMADWQADAIVPSVMHGAAAVEPWALAYRDAVSFFVANGDVAAAQANLQQLCVDFGKCQ